MTLAHLVSGPLDFAIEFGVPALIFVGLYWWSSRKNKKKKDKEPPR